MMKKLIILTVIALCGCQTLTKEQKEEDCQRAKLILERANKAVNAICGRTQ